MPSTRACGPGRRSVVPPEPAVVDQRRFQPAPGDPVALTGTLTTPLIEGWIVHR